MDLDADPHHHNHRDTGAQEQGGGYDDRLCLRARRLRTDVEAVFNHEVIDQAVENSNPIGHDGLSGHLADARW
eukprot:CAMPEP_0172410178 /NCGR_PEP_ID=MMETSP1061-20121228/76745_1 /TAXON_ID=37318 /ORGANISM="Pseudo-nitzschia pungens, Strain cf. pungens" /LENGTH=72 /DNA_ID=CAMNT_0013146349 /DNA_START=1968 /DNA_END=2183 /DNA_ORIENTATION=+